MGGEIKSPPIKCIEQSDIKVGDILLLGGDNTVLPKNGLKLNVVWFITDKFIIANGEMYNFKLNSGHFNPHYAVRVNHYNQFQLYFIERFNMKVKIKYIHIINK